MAFINFVRLIYEVKLDGEWSKVWRKWQEVLGWESGDYTNFFHR